MRLHRCLEDGLLSSNARKISNVFESESPEQGLSKQYD